MATDVFEQVKEMHESTKELEIPDNPMKPMFAVQDLSWANFCAKVKDVRVLAVELNPPVVPTQVVLADTCNHTGNAMIHISESSHLIPYVADATIKVITSTLAGSFMDKGLMLNYVKGDMGLMCFIPYEDKKKIYGYYKIVEGKNFFYYSGVTECNKPIESFSEVSVDPRNLKEELTEDDKIILQNASAKMKKLATSCKNVGSVISVLDNLLLNTIDPAYVHKIIELNKKIAFGNITPQIEK